MIRVPKIGPGGEVTAATVNELIRSANKTLVSGGTASVHDSRLGTGIMPAVFAEPIYGVLSSFGPDPAKDHHYGFREVVPDVDGDWVFKPGGIESQANAEFGPTIIDPAVELNGIGGVDLNTIVRLVPGEYKSDAHGRVDRDWFFSAATQIKSFELTQDLIPTGGGELDTTVEGYFLRDPTREPVTFYPAQLSGIERSGFLSLGIGRRAGNYVQGTKGWAQWVDNARQELVAGELVWLGEWQIITLYASLIAEVRIYDAPLLAGESGPAQLWWMDWDDDVQVSGDENFALINSTYQLNVTNTLAAPLTVGTKVSVQFNRDDYRWYPMPDASVEFFAVVQSGHVNDEGVASRAVSVKTCDYDGSNVTGAAFNVDTPVRANKDTALFTGYVVRYRIMNDGKEVIQNDIWDEPHGSVIWEALDPDNIRDGWALADGVAAMNVNFGGGNVPDLSARFIMQMDDGGRADENAQGDTGGFRLHGPDENNHLDHDNHSHRVSKDDSDTDLVDDDGNNAVTVFDANGAVWTTGVDELKPVTEGTDLLNHIGAFDVNKNTDNRPRYYVMAARIRNA